MAAAGRAVIATRLLAEQGVPVAVLVVIGDGLPEPAEARYRFRVLDGRVGAVVRMPFVPAFRIAADPQSVDLPRRARRALAEIRALARRRCRIRHPQPDRKETQMGLVLQAWHAHSWPDAGAVPGRTRRRRLRRG